MIESLYDTILNALPLSKTNTDSPNPDLSSFSPSNQYLTERRIPGCMGLCDTIGVSLVDLLTARLLVVQIVEKGSRARIVGVVEY